MINAIAFAGEIFLVFFFFLFLFFNIHITGFLVQLHNNYICAPCFMNKKCNPEWLTVTGQ